MPELGEMHSTFANRRDGGIYEKLLLLAVKHREHEQLEQIVSKLLPDDYDLVWEITSLLTMRHDRSTLKRVICLLTQPARLFDRVFEFDDAISSLCSDQRSLDIV